MEMGCIHNDLDHTNPVNNLNTPRPAKLFFIGEEQDENANDVVTSFGGGGGTGAGAGELKENVNVVSQPGKINLPRRYQRLLTDQIQTKTGNDDTAECNDVTVSDNWKDRRQDLDAALMWLRQEILGLKQQDRLLMRQLLDLRATIHQLGGFRSCTSHGSSLSALGMRSLDDITGCESEPLFEVTASDGGQDTSPVTYSDVVAGFQNRTVSLVSMTDTSDSCSPDTTHRLIQFGHSQDLYL